MEKTKVRDEEQIRPATSLVLVSSGDEGATFKTQENALFPDGLHLARDAWSAMGWPEHVRVTVESEDS